MHESSGETIFSSQCRSESEKDVFLDEHLLALYSSNSFIAAEGNLLITDEEIIDFNQQLLQIKLDMK